MDISNMTLDKINGISDDIIREAALNEYQEYFAHYRNSGINPSILEIYWGETINFIENHIYQAIEQYKNRYYKNCKIVKARTNKICGFCGNEIMSGRIYYKYHPFIIDEYEQAFILKCGDIPVCENCTIYIPSDYDKLMLIQQNLEIYEQTDKILDTKDREFYDIDYNALKENVGERLDFKVLMKKKIN